MEVRIIEKRQTKDRVELFALDSGDLVAEDINTIPKDTYVVNFVADAKCKEFPGVCTRGRIHPAAEGAAPTPVRIIRGPLCACKLFKGVPKILEEATDEWLSVHRDGAEIVCVAREAPLHTYTWCNSRTQGARYDGEDFTPFAGQLEQWEYELMHQLRYLIGYYSVVTAGKECIGVWNFIAGMWVGPPIDRRIAAHFRVEFARAFEPDGAQNCTLEDLRRQCPASHMLIIRHAHEIGRVVK